MITLDGVIQGPGSPQEDPSGGFELGGWAAPYDEEVSREIMRLLLQPSDLLLGRKTFQIWESYWPSHVEFWPSINAVTKYVYSTSLHHSVWENTVFLQTLEELKNLKIKEVEKSDSKSHDIQVWGSSELIQVLLTNDLVDELWLMIHPITLGKGKKLFKGGAIPAAFHLESCTATPKGVIMAHYERKGEVETGSFGD